MNNNLPPKELSPSDLEILQLNDERLMLDIDSGDVIEIDRDGEPITVLVLLTTETALILDALDGSTPFVVQAEELGKFRKYEPAL